ncbi:MAG TPA: hypothetical protein PKW33_14715 [Anaerolineaceae bacterium]|nr:hypothetical protein [Anaerolineaceae bacterium]HPN52843.1 hypothetical protein [Anaerolineaceae bacterium]
MRLRKLLILSLPIIILSAWYVVIQAPIWMAPGPRGAFVAGGEVYTSCREAALLDKFEGAALSIEEPAAVSASQARTTARNVMMRYLGITAITHESAPFQARIKSNGASTLVWVYTGISDAAISTPLMNGVTMYVDAQTGVPLYMISGIQIGEPQTGCEANPNLLWDQAGNYLSCGLLSLYVLGLVIAGVVWIIRHPLPDEKEDHD